MHIVSSKILWSFVICNIFHVPQGFSKFPNAILHPQTSKELFLLIYFRRLFEVKKVFTNDFALSTNHMGNHFDETPNTNKDILNSSTIAWCFCSNNEKGRQAKIHLLKQDNLQLLFEKMDLNYVVFKGATKDVHIESSMANTSELGSLDSVFVKEVPQSTPLHRPSFLPKKFSPHIWSNFDSKFCVRVLVLQRLTISRDLVIENGSCIVFFVL